MSEKIHSQQEVFNRYNLSDNHINTLTGKLIESKSFDCEERYVLYRVAGTDEYSDIGRHIERKVFEQTFHGNDSDMMHKEYGPYEDASIFFLTVDREKQCPTGVLRIIKSSPAGLKTINDLSSSHLSLKLSAEEIQQYHSIENWESCWDVATLAILPEYRKTAASASLQLYRAMYVTALEEGIDHMVAIIDKNPLLAMTDYLAIPLEPLCGSDYFSYLESQESRAVYGFIPKFDPIINEKLSRVQYDPIAVRALSKIIRGTEDHTLLLDDYKN